MENLVQITTNVAVAVVRDLWAMQAFALPAKEGETRRNPGKLELPAQKIQTAKNNNARSARPVGIAPQPAEETHISAPAPKARSAFPQPRVLPIACLFAETPKTAEKATFVIRPLRHKASAFPNAATPKNAPPASFVTQASALAFVEVNPRRSWAGSVALAKKTLIVREASASPNGAMDTAHPLVQNKTPPAQQAALVFD